MPWREEGQLRRMEGRYLFHFKFTLRTGEEKERRMKKKKQARRSRSREGNRVFRQTDIQLVRRKSLGGGRVKNDSKTQLL